MLSTSFSRMNEFRECPLKAKLKFLDKVPDPRPELPEGQEHPFERGSRIHDAAERCVVDNYDHLPEELKKFEDRFRVLQKLYKEGRCETERAFAMDKYWRQSDPKDFENTRYRMIADVLVHLSDDHILIIDHKTGRKDGNEIKHLNQGIEYVCVVSMLYPDAKKFTFEVWYIDKGEVLSVEFDRHDLANHISEFVKAHSELWEREVFPPTPSSQACLFCPYKKGTVGRGKNAYAGAGICDKNMN